MRGYNTKEIERDLKKKLDHDRYEHTIGVCYTATALAMRYEYDLDKARIAGLLHDCAKCIPREKMTELCRKHNIQITEVERNHPSLLHAKLGAFLAMKKYKITDEDIISAILNHTTGKPDMGLLDKIIYVADYIEPHRHSAPRLPKIRKTAFLDLDKALFMILEDTLAYLDEGHGQIDPMTKRTYEYYLNQKEDEFFDDEGTC